MNTMSGPGVSTNRAAAAAKASEDRAAAAYLRPTLIPSGRGSPRYPAAVRPRLDQVVIDSRQPTALVRFWAALLGGQPVDRGRGWSHVDAPGFPRLSFQPVPEPETIKNRVHLDVEVDPGDIPAAAATAVDLGAVIVGELVTDDKGSFQGLQDPEGNEFCFVCGRV